MMHAGVLPAGEGPSDPDQGSVVDGRAAYRHRRAVGEDHELLDGSWIVQVSSKEEGRREELGTT